MNKFYPSIYVAFLDILGFETIVQNNDHATLEALYKDALLIGIEICLARGRYVFCDNNGQKVAVADQHHAKINSLTVSDSILLWTDNDSMMAFLDIVATVRRLLYCAMLSGLPLRGAIAIGATSLLSDQTPSPKIYLRQTLFGKGIVDACITERIQLWSGCIIRKECADKYTDYYHRYSQSRDDMASLNILIEKHIIARYPVPKKGDLSKEEYVIDWVNGDKKTVEEEAVRQAFSMHGKSTDRSDVQKKINNTIEFVRCMRMNRIPNKSCIK